MLSDRLVLPAHKVSPELLALPVPLAHKAHLELPDLPVPLALPVLREIRARPVCKVPSARKVSQE